MKNLFMIVFSGNIQRQEVTNFFDGDENFGAWFYSMPNSIFVYTKLAAKEISGLLEQKLGRAERHMIVKLTNTEYYGRIPNDHWSIIHNKGAIKRYDLNFAGYYLDAKSMIETSGVYCVYRCCYVESSDTVTLKELLYIGQAKNIRARHAQHEKLNEWKSRLQQGEQLCYTCAAVAEEDLKRSEAALINLNKPICNQTSKDVFDYGDTYISVAGCVKFLRTDVVVERHVS